MVYQVEEALEEKKTKVVLKEDTIDD
jgi:hypothetical protein